MLREREKCLINLFYSFNQSHVNYNLLNWNRTFRLRGHQNWRGIFGDWRKTTRDRISYPLLHASLVFGVFVNSPCKLQFAI